MACSHYSNRNPCEMGRMLSCGKNERTRSPDGNGARRFDEYSGVDGTGGGEYRLRSRSDFDAGFFDARDHGDCEYDHHGPCPPSTAESTSPITPLEGLFETIFHYLKTIMI